MSKAPVARFLKAVRRRLWLEAVLCRLPASVWAASGTLVVLAITHFMWGLADTRSALTAALVAGLVVLSPALLRRPTLADCARRADRHFDGYSLITTAQEIAQIPAPGPAEQTVITRAANAAGDWRQHLESIWHSPAGSAFVLAAVPAFFGLLILELPAQDDNHGEMFDIDSRGPGHVQAGNGFLEDAGDVPEVRDAIVRSTTQDPAVAAADDAQVPSAVLPGKGETARVELETTQGLPPGIATATNEAGRDAGDARRNAGDIERREPDPGTVFSERVDTAIERRGEVIAGAGDGSTSFAGQANASRIADLTIAPAPAPPTTSAWTSLTAAEVAYARRYLDARGLMDE